MGGSPFDRRIAALFAALPVVIAASLALMGRTPWCEAGDPWPASWDVWSRHNSQHVVDPYTLSHLEHGIGFFLLLTLVAGRWLADRWRIGIVAVVEAAWEIAENTPAVIQRYREATISLDYFGDSIANSLGDYAACLLGLWWARSVPWPSALAVFASLEAIGILWIRDSLLLNVLMLLAPIDAIREWQAALQG